MALSTIPNNMQADLTANNMPAGTVLQVQQSIMDSYSHFSGGTYYALSGMNTNITPRSASSKILVRLQVSLGFTGRYHITKMFRSISGGSDVQIGHGNVGSQTNRQKAFSVLGTGNRLNAHETYEQITISSEFLDSPNTTGVITYKPQIGVYTNHAFTVNAIHYNSGNQDAQWNSAPFSALTVMEIAQ